MTALRVADVPVLPSELLVNVVLPFQGKQFRLRSILWRNHIQKYYSVLFASDGPTLQGSMLEEALQR